MTPTRRKLLGALAGTGAVVLAGCVGGDSGDDDGAGAPDGDASVQVVETEHGETLAGPDGFTLYMFETDEQGAGGSACEGGCAESWPPLTLEEEPTAGAGVSAALSTFEREDGTTQVTANGWPLYYWSGDESEGDVNGQGFNDVWYVLDAAGAPVRGEDQDDEQDDDIGNGGGGAGPY